MKLAFCAVAQGERESMEGKRRFILNAGAGKTIASAEEALQEIEIKEIF